MELNDTQVTFRGFIEQGKDVVGRPCDEVGSALADRVGDRLNWLHREVLSHGTLASTTYRNCHRLSTIAGKQVIQKL